MDTLTAIGMSSQEAAMYMEMAGGNVQLAVNLFFGGGMGAPAPPPASLDVPEWFSVVWPEQKEIPAAWLNQGLTFSEEHGFGILQPKNGPCGLLAAVQAELVKHAFFQEDSKADSKSFGPDFKVSDELLAQTLASMIRRCRPDESHPCVVADWKDSKNIGKQVTTTDIKDASTLATQLVGMLPRFKAKGGAVLLLYSCVLTRTVDAVRKDLASGGMEPPLIVGRFYLCSFEMQSLLMRGKAEGNIGAFNPMAPTTKIDWQEDTGVGMISREFESKGGLPVCDRLMRPSLPIWILHGGDHFTTLFATQPLDDKKGSTFKLYLWNGLPPGGPRMTQLTITAPHGPRPLAAPKHEATFYKPVPGQLDGIIMANSGDKKARPDQFSTWRYECVLAFDDPEVKGAPRPDDMPAPRIYEQGPVTNDKWRCTRCYANRFKTGKFFFNPPEAKSCTECKRPRAEAGWSVWMPFSELTPGWQMTCLHRYGPKITSVLQSKWPGCSVSWDANTPKPAI